MKTLTMLANIDRRRLSGCRCWNYPPGNIISRGWKSSRRVSIPEDQTDDREAKANAGEKPHFEHFLQMRKPTRGLSWTAAAVLYACPKHAPSQSLHSRPTLATAYSDSCVTGIDIQRVTSSFYQFHWLYYCNVIGTALALVLLRA